MNNRQRTLAILNYEKYDRMPVVHFGYWIELLDKWVAEGHITKEERDSHADGNATDREIDKRLGWDYCWVPQYAGKWQLWPAFEYKVLETLPDGHIIYQNGAGLIEKAHPGSSSIPATLGTLMTGREAWEELFLPKLRPNKTRAGTPAELAAAKKEFAETTSCPTSIYAGSIYGRIRDVLGVEELSFLQADDEELYVEIIDTVADVAYQNFSDILAAGVIPDFIHIWEDICFKNGPLVNPEVFEKYAGPHYKKITDLGRSYGVNFCELDCDGYIDKLLPIWFNNGVNIMFPIEVGTWNASIAPWRARYGKELRGVGGMEKNVLSLERSDIDKEIERLRPLVDLGGFIPCVDHRLPPDAKWENVQYYCDRMKEVFSR